MIKTNRENGSKRVCTIIDEDSMLKADMLYQIDQRLKEVMLRPHQPFGGVSVILFGNIIQLFSRQKLIVL